MEERTNNSLLNQYSLFYSIKESMLFKGNKIASFTQLRKRSMLFKGKFYFDKETDKKAIGSVGHIRTLCLIKGPCYSKVTILPFFT